MYIDVDHSKFKKTAKEVDDYVSLLKGDMMIADSKVTSLMWYWQGKDKSEFNQEWSKVKESDSTYTKMVNSFESYSEVLKYAAKEYKSAQEIAVNRSMMLLVF